MKLSYLEVFGVGVDTQSKSKALCTILRVQTLVVARSCTDKIISYTDFIPCSYFGEVSLWTGQALLAIPTLASPIGLAMLGPYAPYAALSSPILEYCLIRFISGVPMLEKGMDEKLKDDPKYKEFKRNVPCFVPIIGSLK